MRLSVRLAGHPLHPMLVHFPIALWTAGVALDVGGLVTGREWFWLLSFGCYAVGLAAAVLAVIAGFLDLVALAQSDPARDVAVSHMLVMVTTWMLFLVSVIFRASSTAMPPPMWTIAVAIVAFLAMVFGGWLGGRLVYGYGVAVNRRGGTREDTK